MSTLSVPMARLLPRRFGVASVAWSRSSSARRWRRALTYALGALWLLDAALQFQPYMFTRAFPRQVIAPAGAGSPGWVADPVHWAAGLLSGNVVAFNALFAIVQLLIGIGLFVAATTRVALAASVVWSLSVWWLGEGLGGIFAGPVSPLAGLPGAVIIYALVALLLWPPRPRPHRDPHRRSVADAGLLGRFGARLAWLLLWAFFAYEAIRPANRRPSGLAESIRAMAAGEPHWLAGLNRFAAGLVAHHGTQYSLALGAVCAMIAVGIFVPSLTRTTVVVAVALSLGIWVIGEDLGQIATGTGTDPNSGLPLALLALCYWAHEHARVPRSAGE